MSKNIIFAAEARGKIKDGILKAARAVKVTLGPRGRNVIMEKGYGGPSITNDGVSIAREISLKDKFENMGAEIVKEVANKTNDLAGDGTTTSVVLLEALVDEGLKHTTIGMNSMAIRSGMEKASKVAVEKLKELAKPVSGKADIKRVASISAESKELGTIIAETIDKVGKDGVVTVEEGQGTTLESDVVEGMEINNGYISPYMVTNPERMEAEYKDAPIIITDKKVSSIKDILPLLEKLAQAGSKDIVLIADDVDGDALATFVVNKLRGNLNVLAVKAPGFGDRKKEMLEDIAITVGGQVISDELGVNFENAELSVLGSASRVLATKDSTIIVGGKGKKQDVDTRVSQLKAQLERTDSKFDKEKLEERIAKLSGGVGVIRVGAATETEMKYLKDKIDDAVRATKAAMDEGVVPGGGSALSNVAAELEKEDLKGMSADEKVGFEIVAKALEMPLRQIAINAGKDDGFVIVSEVQKMGGLAGYDAEKDAVVEDIISVGIIDPVKVSRAGVEHAVSAASIFLTTEAAIAEEPEEKSEPQMPMGGGMPGMGF